MLASRRGSVALALAGALLLVAAPASALSSHDRELLGSPRLEILPAASNSLLVWSESTAAHPRFFQAYVRPIGGGRTTRLNTEGTKAYTGGIDGTKVIFQQVSGNRSDLRIYDTATGHYLPVPPGVNTNEWEDSPTMSGTQILFTRERFGGGRYAFHAILHDTATDQETLLGSEHGRFQHFGPYITTGQVSGDYAVWDDCAGRGDCDVFLRRISTGHTVRLPDRGYEYASSVASDGTVFFVRSGNACGKKARLMRYQGGSVTLVRDFANGRDSFDTFALSATRVVREVDNCRTGDANVNLTTLS